MSFNAIEHDMLERKLNNPQMDFKAVLSLKIGLKKELGKTFNFSALLYYSIKNFK